MPFRYYGPQAVSARLIGLINYFLWVPVLFSHSEQRDSFAKNDKRQHSKRFKSCIDILAREKLTPAREDHLWRFSWGVSRVFIPFSLSLLEQHFLAPHAPNGNSANLSPPMVTVAKWVPLLAAARSGFIHSFTTIFRLMRIERSLCELPARED